MFTGGKENFLKKDISDRDLDVLFGPFEEGEKEKANVWLEDAAMLEDIVVMLGKMPSKGQARKNGWGGEIPKGFKEWKIGKTKFWTWGGYNKEELVIEQIC